MAGPVTVKLVLGDVLRVRSLRMTERLSELFEGDLVLESADATNCLGLALDTLVGHGLTVTVERVDGSERHFYGIVASAVREDDDRIRARIVPFAWELTVSTDIRIFQNMTTPDIVKAVFKEYGFESYLTDSLTGNYKPRVYCTQYRETDWDFVARLLEDEGIYFYFVHEDGKQKLVLADSINAHDKAPGCEELPLLPPSQARTGTEHVRAFSASTAVVPAKYVVRDYFFAKSKQLFEAEKNGPQQHGAGGGEHYDYPGDYAFEGAASGNSLAGVRLEELQVPYQTFRGLADSRGVTCGSLLQITGQAPRDVYDGEYLVTGTVTNLKAGSYTSGGEGFSMETAFDAIESSRPFRPARNTEWPTVHGLHTAFVVGPAGEEIYTDEDGRVLVQFHWDRLGKKDEKSSTWLRVASTWAGASRGWVSVPRIGDEVIVDFLEGDPDWPIITGSVYNGQNRWAASSFDSKTTVNMPAAKTISGYRTKSSPGGGDDNWNALLFEDNKGEEYIGIRAERNFDLVVKNDEHALVKHDRKRQVDNDETIEVKHDRKRKVGNDELVEIKNNQTLKVGKKLLIEVGDEIEIKTGQSKLVMKKDGTITLNGKDYKMETTSSVALKTTKFTSEATATTEMKANASFKVESSAQVGIKGGAMVKVEGGAMLDLNGGGMTTVKGGIVMIN